jgi:ABC-type antimicrobial peptide transport system permease subunit
MTVKQGEDINQRFILLNDSIKKVNVSFDKYRLENGRRLQKVYSDYNLELNNHRQIRAEADSIKNLYLLNKQLYTNAEEDHKREVRHLFGLAVISFFVTVFVSLGI